MAKNLSLTAGFAAIFLALTLGFTGNAAAQLEGASVTPSGDVNETVSTTNPGSVATKAGAVSEVDISQTDKTDKWAGFYGNISGTQKLADGSGNTFYQWTANKLGQAKVVAVPSGDAKPGNISEVTNPNSFLGSEYNSGSDNASATFNVTASVDLAGDTETTSYVETYDTNGDRTYRTYLANNSDTSTNTPTYIAPGKTGTKGFTGKTLNYQMMVGVGESNSDKSFDFYLELP